MSKLTVFAVCLVVATACTGSLKDQQQHQLELSSSGFYDDGTRWWTPTSGPTLTGTASAEHGAHVEALAGTHPLGLAPVVDGNWSLALPAGSIDAAGTSIVVHLVATDTTVTQEIALDDSLPTAAPAPSTIRDERGDRVDFSTGVPIHSHAGAPIALGSGCPDVFIYSYLHGESAPLYGGEDTPNPLAFAFQGMAAHGLGQSARYRVRADSGAIELDWTDAPPVASDGTLTIALHRDGAHAIPLATLAGTFYVDVELADWAGRKTIASACWINHALAAPLAFTAPAEGTGGSAIGALVLGNGSPVSSLLETGAFSPGVYEAAFVQTTAEPIVVDLALAQPAGSFAVTAAFDFVNPVVSTQAIGCGNTCAPRTACVAHAASDARCNTTGILTSRRVTSSGALSTGTWAFSVVGDDGSTPCTTVGPTELRCTIPERIAGASARTYAISATLDDVTNLKPTFGTYGEYTAGAFNYTGLPPTTAFRCNQMVSSLPDANGSILHTCVEWTQYAGITAVAAATLQLAATTLTVTAGADASSLQAINYVVDPIAVPAITWFGGQSGLP